MPSIAKVVTVPQITMAIGTKGILLKGEKIAETAAKPAKIAKPRILFSPKYPLKKSIVL